jgi:hypothetical protein
MPIVIVCRQGQQNKSVTVGWQWRAAQWRHRQCNGYSRGCSGGGSGGSSAAAGSGAAGGNRVVAAAVAAQQQQAAGWLAAIEWWQWQHHGSGVGSVMAVLAARWQRMQKQHDSNAAMAVAVAAAAAVDSKVAGRWRQRGGSGSSTMAARWRQAARKWRLQHSVSNNSTVVALAEQWRQHGSIMATAASVAAALATRGFLICYNCN